MPKTSSVRSLDCIKGCSTINNVYLFVVAGNISAVFTYKWKGEEITRLVDNGTKVMIGIIKGRTFTHINNNINKFVSTLITLIIYKFY